MKRKLIETFALCFVLSALVPVLRAEQMNPAMKHAVDLARDGKYDEAVAEINKTIAADPSVSKLDAHLTLGLVHYKAKKYDDSFREFKQASEIKNDSPMAFYFLGLVNEKMALSAQPDQALQMKKSALESWKHYLEISGKPSASPDAPKKHMGITKKESIKRARKHVKVLEEELNDDKK